MVFWGLYDDLHEHKLTGKYALTAEGKKEIARIILFLRSDFEYRWPPTTCPFILILITRVFLIILSLLGLVRMVFSLGWLIIPLIVFSLIALSLFKSFRKKKSRLVKTEKDLIKGDKPLWPFFSKEEYEYALAHPVYLAGRKVNN